MDSPGASSESDGATFENHETSSLLLVDPTLIADDTHAGADICEPDAPLPDATTLAIPMPLKLSIIVLYGWASQGGVKGSPPRLMLTDAMLYVPALAYTYSSPAMMSDVKAPGHGANPPQFCGLVIREKTCTAINVAPLATPEKG